MSLQYFILVTSYLKRGCCIVLCSICYHIPLIYGCYFQVWHTQVEFYSVFDYSCNLIAYFSMDPYARSPQKVDGAWTVGVFDRSSVMSRDHHCEFMVVRSILGSDSGSNPSQQPPQLANPLQFFKESRLSMNNQTKKATPCMIRKIIKKKNTNPFKVGYQ